MNDVILDVREVAVRFGETAIFQNVSFTARRGDVVVVMGESGVGKTTLLRAIVGLVPYTGVIDLLGQRLPNNGRSEMRRGCVLVTQQPGLWEHLTVLDNVALVRRLNHRETRRASRRTALTHLASLEVEQLARRYPSRLSGGEQQRVALARGIAAEPPLLLLDEVTANIDPERRQLVVALVRQLAAKGMALVCVSHDVPIAHALSNCRLLLRNDGLERESNGGIQGAAT